MDLSGSTTGPMQPPEDEFEAGQTKRIVAEIDATFEGRGNTIKNNGMDRFFGLRGGGTGAEDTAEVSLRQICALFLPS